MKRTEAMNKNVDPFVDSCRNFVLTVQPSIKGNRSAERIRAILTA